MNKMILAFALALLPALAFPQAYPSKPVRLIVGFPPGGSADPTARIVGAALSEQLGQPVVVENRPGADSVIAAQQLTTLAPDGYTLMFASNSALTAGVVLRKNSPYDPLTAFSPIGLVGRATIVMYAHPEVPAKNLKEFIDHVKANPGKLNYGTGNANTIMYFTQLNAATGMNMVMVPYKGEGPLNPDLVAGRVQSSFLSTPTALSLAKEGRLRPLAVLADRRSALLPDVPTIGEAGVPQVTAHQWAGVFGPPGLPKDIVARLNKELNAALAKPDVSQKLLAYGYNVEGSTPERLTEITRDDPALWRKPVQEARIELD